MSAYAPPLYTASRLNFEEWMVAPAVHPLASSETLGWTDIDLYTTQISTQPESTPVVSDIDPILILQLSGTVRWQGTLDDKAYDQHLRFGTLGLIPANNGIGGRWNGTSMTTAYLRLSSQLITELTDEAFRGDSAHVQLLPLLNLRDPLLYQLITELCGELQNPNPFGALFAESASRTIMLHLLRKYSTAAMTQQPSRAQLTTRHLHMIDDYLESRLDTKIALSDLASLLFMSVSHFERTFRATLGCAPYRYILERRIERSKWLLSKTAYSLHEVAYQCGFANQSHFTRHFTKLVGISPARFRESLKE